ncbi:WGR domain-containing protein [Roseicitreum antarcticum]|uniref:WGR domain-containing protein n=1 Tax=Roseicitreum antarcticum TaxID=564137 RepID=UPI000B83AD59
MDLKRIDRLSNACRFYRMEIVPGLFGDWSLMREWGRIGQSGQPHEGRHDEDHYGKTRHHRVLQPAARQQ